MRILFVKLHWIIFEFVSIALYAFIFGMLIYYLVIFPNVFYLMQKDEGTYNKHLKFLDIKFSAKFEKGVFSDVNIKIYHKNATTKEETRNAMIIYNDNLFKNKPKENDNITEMQPFFDELNEKNPYNIFFFENKTIAENLMSKLFNIKSQCKFLNIVLFLVIILFLIFIKISLTKNNINWFRKIKSSKADIKNPVHSNLLIQLGLEQPEEEDEQNISYKVYYNPVLSLINPLNVYYSIIFHITFVVIIPFVIPEFINYQVNSYIGMESNQFYSVYYGRTYYKTSFMTEEKIILDELILKGQTKESLFIGHPALDVSKYAKGGVSPGMINILVMCAVVWLSQIFKPFPTKEGVKINDVDLKVSKFKKYMWPTIITILFLLWGVFAIWGLISGLDTIILYHKVSFLGAKHFCDFKVALVLVAFYYHIYFYVILIAYTLQIYHRNKKHHKKRMMKNFPWFE